MVGPKKSLLGVCLGLLGLANQADVMVFQQGVNGYSGTEDTMLTSDAARQHHNWGAYGLLYAGPSVRTGEEVDRSLIRFDVSALDGQYSSINSITLRLAIASIGADAVGPGNSVDLMLVGVANSDWQEGSSINSQELGAASWAYKAESGVEWFGGPGLGSTGASSAFGISTTYQSSTTGFFDLTHSDLSTVDGLFLRLRGGRSFLLKTTDETTNGDRDIAWYSSESPNVAFRPQLIVDFVPVPEPRFLVTAIGVGLLGVSALRQRSRCRIQG